jgi:hypothetical protein
MNEIWFIGVGAVILIGLFTLAFWFASNNKTPVSNSQNGQVGLPVAGSVGQTTTTVTASSQGTTVPIATAGGGTVQTNNFLKDPTTAKDPINSGYYYLGYHVNEGVPDPTITANPPYIIEYISATQYFNITLLQEPIGTTREEAQQYLMAHLDVSQDQMCQLNYMVSVPNSVNSRYAGESLGFSFCPGATVLPE